MAVRDTIVAAATPPGRSAVAVVRVSGAGTLAALAGLGVRPGRPREAVRRKLRDGAGQVIDEALVIWFPGPRSYTGEDSAELHLHGAPFVVDQALQRLLGGGARLAQPGEFTRRAFENGKLDLGQAEAVADLVDAETKAQVRQALAQLGGALGRRHQAWRGALIEASARLEAAVDFPDEDIEPAIDLARQRLEGLRTELADAAAEGARGLGLREGFRVAIVGPPNAGKSTLLNALAMRDLAIVTAVPGTTRDVIETAMDIAGYRVLLADTAGLRQTEDLVEREGVRRAQEWAMAANARLWVVDGSAQDGWEAAAGLVAPGDLCVINKADLPPGRAASQAAALAASVSADRVCVALTDGGAGVVRAWLECRVAAALGSAEFPAATRQRHLDALAEAADCVTRALCALDSTETPELAAEDVRLAARALGRVTGAVGADDVLDEVFSTFCIGK
jgi:tRNA modification GTPase